MKTKSIVSNVTVLLAVCLLSARTSSAAATARYVNVGNASPAPPYTNWATAAMTIQDAVNAANSGDTVLVTNGIYATGGLNTVSDGVFNRVVVGQPLTLLSVNGPKFTVIYGQGTSRCVYLSDGASLTGFTLTNGAASGANGGGVSCASTNAFLTNCVIRGNWASGAYAFSVGTGEGGGAYQGTFYQCTLSGNQAVTLWIPYPYPPPYEIPVYGYGGGAYGSVLYNCTVSDNSAQDGSGVYESTLYNCTLDRNSGGDAHGLGGGACWSTLYDCTLTHNTNTYGGGACYGTLYNCILTANYGNTGGGAGYATLYNCRLATNSAGPRSYWANGEGGGAFDGTLYNCIVTGNSANGNGGGTYSTLYNCVLTGNSAAAYGGGAASGNLYNCTLTGNSAGIAGGGADSTLYNCIIYSNTAPQGANYVSDNSLNYCCTTPLPTNGVGNITSAPQFVDYANGNLRLQSNSPCVNAGNNGYMTNTTDLDGRPRIVGGKVDIGAYEFQPGVSGLFIGWLQQYGLPTDGAADYLDADKDGLNNWQEWRCGTCPTNARSVLRLLSASPIGSNVAVTWQSVAGINYSLECGTNLVVSPGFQCVAKNCLGQSDATTFVHTNASAASPLFYRVGVQ